jgi:hypothetical protein
MKLKRLTVSSQLLIITLAALVLGLTLQMAQAQVLQINMPQKDFWRDLAQKTTLGYYTQLLGPTMAGTGGETYNVFQESRTPYQNFHAINLRYQVNSQWAFGASIAAVNAYGETTTSQQGGYKGTMLRDEFFNARLFLSLPPLRILPGTLFTTVSYEAPTSVVAREQDMRYGLVLAQSFAFALPSVKWTAGLSWQYYRAYYPQNVVAREFNPPFGDPYTLIELRQTAILSVGPYAAYRFNDRWGMNSSVTFDWDQRGNQTSTSQFNNNLPDRARVGVSYFPTIKNITSVGVFTQGLLKYTADTQAMGGEMALRF